MEASPAEQDDGTLLTTLRQGDAQAFEQLVQRYNARLLRLIERFVADRILTEDVLQHVWLQFYSSQATLSPHGSMWPWLARVARNRCIDERRSLRRAPLLFSRLHLPELEDEESVLLELPDPAPTPEEQVERDEMQQTIEAALCLAARRSCGSAVASLRELELPGNWTSIAPARSDGQSSLPSGQTAVAELSVLARHLASHGNGPSFGTLVDDTATERSSGGTGGHDSPRALQEVMAPRP